MAVREPVSAVADAAAWLARQGIEVPAGADPAASERSTGLPSERRSGAPSGRPSAPRSSAGGGRRRNRPEGDEASGDRPDDAEADPYAVARSIALTKLTAQARTRLELARALQAREVPAEVADEVLDRLTEVGLVDDAAFARDWVESRQQRRHLSGPALRRELQAKGVDRDEIDAALSSVEFTDELAAARELARRRERALTGQPYAVRYRRIAGALSRRGFGSAVVTQVLREVLKED